MTGLVVDPKKKTVKRMMKSEAVTKSRELRMTLPFKLRAREKAIAPRSPVSK